jgi:type II secretory pathway component GspD/PulD (secretin)
VARVLVASLLLAMLASAQTPRVRQEGGRFWVQCQSASLEDVIREIAALSPMELWLDEGLSDKRVTANVERATLKQALEELFEQVSDVNYVFTFDLANPERVTKIYAGGGGGGRLGREPTVAAPAELPENSPTKPSTKEKPPR